MNQGGGLAIPQYLRYAVQNHLEEHSNIASNRLVRVRDHSQINDDVNDEHIFYMPARYLEDNKTELYKSFGFRDQVSKSTFFKYANINNQFKKPYR